MNEDFAKKGEQWLIENEDILGCNFRENPSNTDVQNAPTTIFVDDNNTIKVYYDAIIVF